jgi:transposase InsO family protein
MKDELRDAIAACTSFEAVQAKVDDWMDYYNNDRYQWDLKKLSPKEYYQYLQSGVYPLPVHDPCRRKAE